MGDQDEQNAMQLIKTTHKKDHFDDLASEVTPGVYHDNHVWYFRVFHQNIN